MLQAEKARFIGGLAAQQRCGTPHQLGEGVADIPADPEVLSASGKLFDRLGQRNDGAAALAADQRIEQLVPLVDFRLAARPGGADTALDVRADNAADTLERIVIAMRDNPVLRGEPVPQPGADDLEERRYRGVRKFLQELVGDPLRQPGFEGKIVDRDAGRIASERWSFDNPEQRALFPQRAQQKRIDAAAARPLAEAVVADRQLVAKPPVIFRAQRDDEPRIDVAQIDVLQKPKES